jgi:SanA protein
MARRRTRTWLKTLGAALAVGAAAFALASVYVERRYSDRVVPLASAPASQIVLVYGAGLARGPSPSPILAERLDAALALYRAGKVQKLLVSGDNSDRFHDETEAMRRYAIERGVPAEDVLGDDAGLSTYDSTIRAKDVFGIRRALLVTQRFHLPRALYIANGLGIDAYGVAADEGKDVGSTYALRELISRPVALTMVLFQREANPLPACRSDAP